MIKRVIAATTIAVGLLVSSGAAPSSAVTDVNAGDWFCLAVDAVIGLCQGDPIPTPQD